MHDFVVLVLFFRFYATVQVDRFLFLLIFFARCSLFHILHVSLYVSSLPTFV